MENTKEKIQKELEKEYNKKLIILEWATGTGKSFGAIRLANKIKPNKVLLLVAEATHKLNWITEFNKYANIFGNHAIQDAYLVIECYASLKNYNNTYWDLVICDEVHHLSELRLEVMKTLKIKHLIALSATLNSEQIDNLYAISNTNKEDSYHSKITLNTAISWGLIPEPDVYLIPLELDNINRNQTIIDVRGDVLKRKTIKCNFDDMWTYKKDKINYPNLELIISCTEAQKNQWYEANIEFYKNLYLRNNQNYIKTKWMRLGSERKRFLGNLKTKYALTLISKLKDKKKFICFCTSIDQAELLGGDKAIHSNNKDNFKILDDFQNNKIKELYCIDKIKEGSNLNGIEAGIIIQLDGKELPFIQKHGRVLRSDNPIQFIFYFKNTRDVEYLSNILNNINKEYVQIITNLNDFKCL